MAAPALAQRSDAPKPASKAAATARNNPATAVDSPSLAASTPKGERSSGGSRVALFIAAAAIVGGVWFLVRSRGESAKEPPRDVPSAAPEQATLETSPPVQPKVEPRPVASVEAVPTAEPTASSNAPAATAVASAEPQRSSDELIVVTVTTIPSDARFFYKGKPVGRSPFRVELKPGQRRSFEIGHPGFYARKVVVDGTKTEMTVAMRPAAPTPTTEVPAK